MDLASWQVRLQSHFEQLRRKRTASAGEKPLFGLEHGLCVEELESLKEAIRVQVADGSLSEDCPLPWVVYASEMGYQYSGDEYWQTFEENTPAWEDYGDRHWIRTCFRNFHTKFGGARPSGPWAEHFCIICWPITHAILPKDLQRQLARILYDARHELSAEHFDSPLVLGELIAARGWNATSRFQQLAQEPELIGQIAAALLLPEEKETDRLILSTTLKRISEDLDRQRRARDWLRDAQRLAQQRIQFRGLSKGRKPQESRDETTIEYAREKAARLGIEPRLVLRPTPSSSWDVLIEIPDLSHLLIQFPKLRKSLTGSRCIVAGSSGRPVARGGFLYGPMLVRLQKWPEKHAVLLSFESSSQELGTLLTTECLLRPGPLWLFRVASDGLAYEVRRKCVRPDQKYILLNTEGSIQSGPGVGPLSVTCSGVHAAQLNLDSAIPNEVMEHLQRLGVGQAMHIEVWPAGLTAASWDGQGHAEWLSSEAPCVGVRADYDVDQFTLILDDDAELLEIKPTSPGAPAFVALPELSVGLHELVVAARSAHDVAREEAGYLQIAIRDPISWKPGVGSQGAILVVVDPTNPSLEELWEGRAAVEIHGPASRHIRWDISLFEKRASEPFLQKKLPPLQLPTNASEWRANFERHFRQNRECQNSYDQAHLCTILFDAEELGAFTLTCEREFTPLRWVIHRSSQAYGLRLLDDVGSGEDAVLFHYKFDTPESSTRLQPTEFRKLRTPAEPGLYLALSGHHRRAVVLPPAVRTLEDLSISPRISMRDRSPERISGLLRAIDIWANARLTGDIISRMRRRKVVLALLQHLFQVIGGSRWGRTERQLARHPSEEALLELKRAISNKRHEAGLGAALAGKRVELANRSISHRISYLTSLATRFLGLSGSPESRVVSDHGVEIIRRPAGGENLQWLSEFALRLASAPEGIMGWV